MRLEGKIALVTGGASGIGLATVRRFAAEGARVVAVDLDAQRTSEAVAGLDGVTPFPADVRRSAEVEAAFAECDRLHGPLDVLVNAAGISGPTRVQATEFGGDIEDITDEDFAEVIEVNLYGSFYALRAATRRMRPAGRGSIINVSSVGAIAPFPLQLPYPASKAGVLGMTRAAAARLAPEGIRVNAIAPGATDTPMLSANGPEARQVIIDLAPMKRVASADEMAATILFLASDESAFYVGQTLSPNGGFVMA